MMEDASVRALRPLRLNRGNLLWLANQRKYDNELMLRVLARMETCMRHIEMWGMLKLFDSLIEKAQTLELTYQVDMDFENYARLMHTTRRLEDIVESIEALLAEMEYRLEPPMFRNGAHQMQVILAREFMH